MLPYYYFLPLMLYPNEKKAAPHQAWTHKKTVYLNNY